MTENTPAVTIMHVSKDGTQFVAVPMEWVQRVTAFCSRYEAENAPPPTLIEQLQAQAEYNRNNATRLYHEDLYHDPRTDRWIHAATGNPVVFTPYGWIIEEKGNPHD